MTLAPYDPSTTPAPVGTAVVEATNKPLTTVVTVAFAPEPGVLVKATSVYVPIVSPVFVPPVQGVKPPTNPPSPVSTLFSMFVDKAGKKNRLLLLLLIKNYLHLKNSY